MLGVQIIYVILARNSIAIDGVRQQLLKICASGKILLSAAKVHLFVMTWNSEEKNLNLSKCETVENNSCSVRLISWGSPIGQQSLIQHFNIP